MPCVTRRQTCTTQYGDQNIPEYGLFYETADIAAHAYCDWRIWPVREFRVSAFIEQKLPATFNPCGLRACRFFRVDLSQVLSNGKHVSDGSPVRILMALYSTLAALCWSCSDLHRPSSAVLAGIRACVHTRRDSRDSLARPAPLKQFRFTHESPEPDVWGFSTVRYRCAFVTCRPDHAATRPGPALLCTRLRLGSRSDPRLGSGRLGSDRRSGPRPGSRLARRQSRAVSRVRGSRAGPTCGALLTPHKASGGGGGWSLRMALTDHTGAILGENDENLSLGQKPCRCRKLGTSHV